MVGCKPSDRNSTYLSCLLSGLFWNNKIPWLPSVFVLFFLLFLKPSVWDWLSTKISCIWKLFWTLFIYIITMALFILYCYQFLYLHTLVHHLGIIILICSWCCCCCCCCWSFCCCFMVTICCSSPDIRLWLLAGNKGKLVFHKGDTDVATPGAALATIGANRGSWSYLNQYGGHWLLLLLHAFLRKY